MNIAAPRPVASVSGSGASRGWVPPLILLSLVLLPLVVYFPVIHFEFLNFDDPLYVTDNSHVRRGLTWDGLKWAFTEAYGSNWHPVTWLSHMADCQLFGKRPGPPHAENVALHIANTLLLFGLLRRFQLPFWPSWLAAAWFAVHPTHIESVAWISERKDVLSTFFLLLAIWAYVRYAQSDAHGPNSRGWVWYGFAFLLFALGLMAKPMLVTGPLLLLLLDYWPLGRVPGGWRIPARLLEKAPFALLAAASCLVTIWAQRESLIPVEALPVEHRLANSLLSYWRYIGNLFWPVHLAAFYPFGAPWPGWLAIIAAAGLMLVTVATFLARRRRWLIVGWLWFVITLVPVIGLVQVGQQAMADRYLYIPCIGLFVLLAMALWELGSSFLAGAAGLVTVATCCVLTMVQVRYWRDSESLFRHAIAVTRDNYAAYNNLGTALEAKGKFDEAIEMFQKALAVRPNSSEAKNNLGSTLSEQGRFAEAEVPLSGAIKFTPGYAQAHYNLGVVYQRQGKSAAAVEELRRALALKDDLPNAHNNLGCLLMAAGDLKQAEAHFHRALQLRPDDALALNNLGTTLTDVDRASEGVQPLLAAIELDPNYADAHYNLGNAYFALNRLGDAEAQYRKALKLDSGHALAHYKLGNALFKAGNSDTAAAEYRLALTLAPRNAEAHYQLGFVLASSGELREAVGHYQEAVRLKPNWLEALNNLAWALSTSRDESIRDGVQALKLATRQVELTRTNDCEALDTLAAAYAQAGQFQSAVEAARQGIALARQAGKTNLVSDMSGRLKLYERAEPYRE